MLRWILVDCKVGIGPHQIHCLPTGQTWKLLLDSGRRLPLLILRGALGFHVSPSCTVWSSVTPHVLHIDGVSSFPFLYSSFNFWFEKIRLCASAVWIVFPPLSLIHLHAKGVVIIFLSQSNYRWRWQWSLQKWKRSPKMLNCFWTWFEAYLFVHGHR